MKYSVITINYNHRDGLYKTIKSVINQTYSDYEFIVIDGGSTDGSKETIEEHADQIDYWVSEPDKGIYNAMNKGIKKANGEYLIFMNSGDVFYDNTVLERSLPYMHEDIVQGIAKNQDQTETPLCLVKISNRTGLFSPSLHHQSCFFKRSLFDRSLYDEHYKIVADWKFYIEQIIFYDSSFLRMPEYVAIYEGGGISEFQRELDFEERKDIIENISQQLKETGRYSQYKQILMHLMFTSKQRYLINRNILNIDKYITTFPESSGYYKYYPFTRKQKVLFFLAQHRMTFLLKIITRQ